MFDFLKRRPDFLILGAQKAGTSALAVYLSQHPRIKFSMRKEVGFFSRDKMYRAGSQWYARQFPHRIQPGILLFEASPDYLYYPFVAERIFQFQPRMKLIILVRNPVGRAFSAWNMYRQFHATSEIKTQIIREYYEDANDDIKRAMLDLIHKREVPDFHSMVSDEINSLTGTGPKIFWPGLVQRGLYREQIERFSRLFPKENILILESAGLKARRVETLNRVLCFLGLPEYDWSRADLGDKHARPYDSKMPDQTQKLLQDFFQPHNARLRSILGPGPGWWSSEHSS